MLGNVVTAQWHLTEDVLWGVAIVFLCPVGAVNVGRGQWLYRLNLISTLNRASIFNVHVFFVLQQLKFN